MSRLEGTCHCGSVTISLAEKPIEASECNCSLCQRYAGLRQDLPRRMIDGARF